MIEEEIYQEIQDDKANCISEGDYPTLFCKEEWDSLVHWSPVSNIPVEEIYKDLPKVKRWHDSYEMMWLNKKQR